MPEPCLLEQSLIIMLLWSSLVTTLGYLLLRVMDRLFGRHIDPRLMHGIWLLLVLRMIVPLKAPDWFAFYLPPVWQAGLLSIWAAGFGGMFFLRLWQGYLLRREILQQEVTLPEWLHRDFLELRRKMRIRTRPVLMVTNSSHGPLLCGVLRPLIVFPVSFIKQLIHHATERNVPRRSVGYVLRHELCHLRGGDLWLSWLWILARSAHWFNPLLAGAGNSLRVWRELSCDLRTLRSMEVPDPTKKTKDPIYYAQMLLDTASFSSGVFQPVEAAASVVEPFNEMERRISMLTNAPLSLTRRLTANSTVLVSILLLLIFSCPGLWDMNHEAVAATGDVTEANRTVSAANSGVSTTAAKKKYCTLSCVDSTAESMRSIAAGGHAVLFEKRPAEGKYLEAIAMCCARYGVSQAPNEDFYLYVMKEKEQKEPLDLSAENLMIIAQVPVPYSKVERLGADEKLSWYKFPTPAIELPEGRFLIAASFNPHQTKGIYLGIDQDAKSDDCKSFIGLPEDGYAPLKDDGQWMISAKLSQEPTEGLKQVRLSDAKPAYEPDKVGDDQYKVVSYCGKQSEGQQSYGGAGPVLIIPLEEALGVPKEKLGDCKLAGISLWGSRYGAGFNPKTMKFGVVLTDASGNVLERKSFPYSKFSYTPRTVNLAFPKPIELEDYIQEDGKLYLGIDPKAEQMKGIYFHYTKNDGESSHSGVLVPDNTIKPAPDREWMIQCFFIPPEGEKK